MAAEYAPFFNGVPQLESKGDLKTVGFDARFPNANQTKNCWQNYVDFYRCLKIKGATHQPCKQFLTAFLQLCPTQWVEKWDEQRANGTFPHKDL